MTSQSPNCRFDNSNPRFLIVYKSDHVEADDNRNIFQRWAVRLKQCAQETGFGLLIILHWKGSP